MRHWGYGINGCSKTAHVYLEESSFLIFWLDRLAWAISELIPPVPFPKIQMRLTHPDDIEFGGGEWTTWREWYGDLAEWWYVYVQRPVSKWCHRHTKTILFKIPYDTARDFFYEQNKAFWDRKEAKVR